MPHFNDELPNRREDIASYHVNQLSVVTVEMVYNKILKYEPETVYYFKTMKGDSKVTFMSFERNKPTDKDGELLLLLENGLSIIFNQKSIHLFFDLVYTQTVITKPFKL